MSNDQYALTIMYCDFLRKKPTCYFQCTLRMHEIRWNDHFNLRHYTKMEGLVKDLKQNDFQLAQFPWAQVVAYANSQNPHSCNLLGIASCDNSRNKRKKKKLRVRVDCGLAEKLHEDCLQLSDDSKVVMGTHTHTHFSRQPTKICSSPHCW